MKSRRTTTRKASMALAAIAALVLGAPVLAYGESDMITTLRDPLIPNVPNGPAWSDAPLGDPPPVGSGSVPMPVTPGDYGSPFAVPSVIPGMPLENGGDKNPVNSAVAPYLTPPPSTEGQDPGSINGSSGGYGLQAPVSWTNINSAGGISGNAPTTRWGGQTTTDYGKPNNVRPYSSSLRDFGQKLTDKPDLYRAPNYSQDGPKPRGSAQVINGQYGQTTTDLYGQRVLFKDQRQVQTIAPY